MNTWTVPEVVLRPSAGTVLPGLDELRCMKTGSFFSPPIFFMEPFDLIHKLLCNPLRISVPLNILDAVMMWMGRGLPSRPRRPQSHNLKVKM